MEGDRKEDDTQTYRESKFHMTLIAISSLLIYFIYGLMFNTQGLLYPYVLEEFEKGEVATSWIIGVRNGACQISALLCCWLADVFQYRTMCIFGGLMLSLGMACSAFVKDFDLLYFTYGALTGAGIGFTYVPALLVPQLWFDKRRALAISITGSGVSLATMIYAPILQVIINSYGWRGAVLLTAAVCFHGCAFAIVLVTPKINSLKKLKSPTDNNGKNDMGSITLQSIQNLNNIEADNSSRKGAFWARIKSLCDISELRKSGPILFSVFVLWIMFSVGYPCFGSFLPYITSTYGVPEETASYILSVYGVSELVSRLFFGVLGSVVKMDSVLLWCFINTGAGIAQILTTWAETIYAFYPFAAMYGFFVGGWYTYSSVALVDLFGIEQVAKSYGLMQLAQAIAYFASTPLLAAFSEATGIPSTRFLLAGSLQCFGGFVLFVHYMIKRHVKLYREKRANQLQLQT